MCRLVVVFSLLLQRPTRPPPLQTLHRFTAAMLDRCAPSRRRLRLLRPTLLRFRCICQALMASLLKAEHPTRKQVQAVVGDRIPVTRPMFPAVKFHLCRRNTTCSRLHPVIILRLPRPLRPRTMDISRRVLLRSMVGDTIRVLRPETGIRMGPMVMAMEHRMEARRDLLMARLLLEITTIRLINNNWVPPPFRARFRV